MDRVLKVPDSFRRFKEPSVDARRVHGISPDLLEVLLDLGLPHKGTRETACFDRFDLENIGVELRLPSKHWLSMRMWARHLDRPRTQQDPACRICISWQCPDPGHSGDCSFSASPQLLTASSDVTQDISHTRSLDIDVLLENEACTFGGAFHSVSEAAQQLIFHRIPNKLVEDHGFLTETLLADCRSATRHLVRVAVSSGIEVRPASGFFVGAPFPAVHNWLELRHDGRWVAADPFFLTTLHKWGLADKEKWPVTSSPQKVLWRLSSADSIPPPLVLHGEGLPAVTSLMAIHRTGHEK